MPEKDRYARSYGGKAFVPLIVFLLLYVGCGIVFTILGFENAFEQIPRYVALLAGIAIALVFYARDVPFSDKVDIYCKGAGRSGIMWLSIVILLAGAFQGGAKVIGAQDSVVNMCISFIPSHFLVPGMFVIACVISACTGTSLGTQVAVIPLAAAMAQSSGQSPAMMGAAAIAGAYFGDAVTPISSALLTATNSTGSEVRDVAKTNFLLAVPALLITVVAYTLLSSNGGASAVTEAGVWHIWDVIPYLLVIVVAMAGVSVIITLMLGIVSTGVIGVLTGSCGILDWTSAMGSGMEDMFFLIVFATMVSGLIQLIEYYGGIDWLLEALSKRIKSPRGCEALISLVVLFISGATLNNNVAIIVAAPIAQQIGVRFGIKPVRIACLLALFSSAVFPFIPYDSSILLAQQCGAVSYIELVRYAIYPAAYLLMGVVFIALGSLGKGHGKDEPGAVAQDA